MLHAQPRAGVLELLSDPPGAEVFLDSIRLGFTPLLVDTVSPGQYLLQVFYPSARAWDPLRSSVPVKITEDGTTRLELPLGTYLRIASVPSGAEITSDGIPIGKTPAIVRNSAKRPELLSLAKEGHRSLTTPLIDPGRFSYSFILEPERTDLPPEILILPDMYQNNSTWHIWTAGAAMLASGALSAYYKTEADRAYGRYEQTGSRAEFDLTKKYDNRAAILLVTTQISFGLLTLFLFSR